MKVCAPGKLILSGEHAVVYGQPALAMAVNRYVTATVTPERMPHVFLDLSDLAHRSRLSLAGLRHLKSRIKQKYYRFVRGDYSIREVLQKPFELAQFALGVLTESLNLSLPHGMKIQVQSNIPIGCGMGSSAATILSVMHAISTYLQINISPDALFQLALEAENVQHGHSSGLDLRVASQGGCVFVNEMMIEPRSVPKMTMYLANTGIPFTTTGQCVETVAPHFVSKTLQTAFADVTIAMDKALQQQSLVSMQEAIRANHRLLTTIGVVPSSVQAFIEMIEKRGGAAKICGAGAVAGEAAGAVLILTEDHIAMSAACQQFGYELISIAGEPRGVHVV